MVCIGTRARGALALALGIAVASTSAGCGGGGGGSGGSSQFDRSAQLLSITFPDPTDVNGEPEDVAPLDAPLAQQVVFTFSGRPDPNRIGSLSLPIRDASGRFVEGSYAVDDAVVTFSPELALRPVSISASGGWDAGGGALIPASTYTIRVGPATSSFVESVAADLLARHPDPADPRGVIVGFRTTTDPSKFRGGLPIATPRLVATDPPDGTTGLSPNLFSDPDDLFAPRRSFVLEFDGPLSPDSGNVGDATVRLIDLDDPGFPAGLSLGIDVTLIENRSGRSLVRITPSGILPFGHLLALECASDLRSFSDPSGPNGSMSVATTFTIAEAPASSVRDRLEESFDTNDRAELDPREVGVGRLRADWNVRRSGLLEAGFTFRGDGALGRFLPPAPASGKTSVITLDTARQVFPLPDGSTPDAPPGFEVIGGVFPFSEIDVPAGIVIRPVGGNPLVLTATGSVRIAGAIELLGEAGTSDNAYDSAITSVPGGAAIAGGGRGGESHPILFFPPDQASYANLVSPPMAGAGFGIDATDGVMKRIGGTGGECGTLDQKNSSGNYATEQEIACWEDSSFHNGEKVPGGGGGSLLRKGLPPLNPLDGSIVLNGTGNVRPDGLGSYQASDDRTLLAGVGGVHPFASDGDAENDFFGSRGQLTRMIGGQGGGGGATRTESYYCGWWCDHDADSTNDKVCNNEDNLYPTWGGSVGDARGGGGGGGGGALQIQALGPITIAKTGRLNANGGLGGGGEVIGFSNLGGGGGGGAGGMVILQSASGILVDGGAEIRVLAGAGDSASDPGQWDEGGNDGAPGDGGIGGDGLIQLQVPLGQQAVVVNPSYSLVPKSSWIDPTNQLNPAEFTPESVAISKWSDLGRVIVRPPVATNPIFSFRGLDPNGYVQTDASGNIVAPDQVDIVCGYLGQKDPQSGLYRKGEEPRGDFIPTNASVRVEFQGANAIAPGSKEVDPASLTPWMGKPDVANGKQFLRWRVTFDLAADGSPLAPTTRRPVVFDLAVGAEF